VAGFTVDAVWPAQQLIVELDGYAFHGTRAAFERDRARDAELQQRRLPRRPPHLAAPAPRARGGCGEPARDAR
jgi:hypothetical protein